MAYDVDRVVVGRQVSLQEPGVRSDDGPCSLPLLAPTRRKKRGKGSGDPGAGGRSGAGRRNGGGACSRSWSGAAVAAMIAAAAALGGVWGGKRSRSCSGAGGGGDGDDLGSAGACSRWCGGGSSGSCSGTSDGDGDDVGSAGACSWRWGGGRSGSGSGTRAGAAGRSWGRSGNNAGSGCNGAGACSRGTMAAGGGSGGSAQVQYLEELEGWVLDEQKVVTFRWLALVLSVTANAAKKMLYDFCQRQGERKVSATYLVVGKTSTGGSGAMEARRLVSS
eukprot:g15484.t1